MCNKLYFMQANLQFDIDIKIMYKNKYKSEGTLSNAVINSID